jgi:hypothetical protein
MALAMIIESDGTVAAVMESVSVLDDDGGTTVMMPVMMRPDDHISLGSGCDSRSSDAERQSGEKHCFHWKIPVVECPFAPINRLLADLFPCSHTRDADMVYFH